MTSFNSNKKHWDVHHRLYFTEKNTEAWKCFIAQYQIMIEGQIDLILVSNLTTVLFGNVTTYLLI